MVLLGRPPMPREEEEDSLVSTVLWLPRDTERTRKSHREHSKVDSAHECAEKIHGHQ